MPAVIPILIGTAAFAGGALAAKKLAPKPTAAAAPAPAPEPAPVTAPPPTTQLNSDAQAEAIQAGIKRRRTASSAGILGPKPTGAVGGVTAKMQPKSLIGGSY